MNRRTSLKLLLAIPFVSASQLCQARDAWKLLDRRNPGPNSRSISFDLRQARGIAKLGIELRGNSIWLHHLKLVDGNGTRIQAVNLNIPLTREGCQPRLAGWPIGEHGKSHQLSFECLALGRQPTQLLLWGSA